jgi:NAD(P)-dependent dehydrogenase (short-subunit alcohol dehydrogenase family)
VPAPGLGAAVARRFGTEGFTVAVMYRSQDRVDSLAGDLTTAGVTARGYAADVREPDALTAALARAADDLGPVEVLQYSPVPQAAFMHPVLDTTVADLTVAIEFSVYGPLTAVRHVLPGMRALGRGTVLSSTAAAAPDRTRRSPAPRSRSPPKAPTRPCCTPP